MITMLRSIERCLGKEFIDEIFLLLILVASHTFSDSWLGWTRGLREWVANATLFTIVHFLGRLCNQALILGLSQCVLCLHLCLIGIDVLSSCLLKLLSMRVREMQESVLLIVLFLHLLGVVTLCLDSLNGFNIFIDLLLLYLSFSVFHVGELFHVEVHFSLLLSELFDSILNTCLLPLFSNSQVLEHLLLGFLIKVFVEEHCLLANSILFS